MSHKYLFKSERLGFRVWIKGDLHEFGELNADKDVMKCFPLAGALLSSAGCALRTVFKKVTPVRKQVVLTLIILLTLILIWVELAVGIL